MVVRMHFLFAALLLSVALAEEMPMSEEEYLASKKKTSFRSTVGTKPTAPPHLQNMFDNLSVEIVPKMTGLQKMKTRAVSGKSHRPAWIEDADATPKPVNLDTTPVKLNANGIEVTPTYILGPDDRRYFSSKAFPFSTVAKVTMSNGGRCSGVLIGPRHVLTASHCVNWSGAYPTSVEINRQGSYVAGTSRVINIYYWQKVSTPTAPYRIADVDNDYVVMILNTRLGDAFGWLGYTTYQSAWDFQSVLNTIGYAGDRSNMEYPIYQFGFYGDESDFDGTKSGLAIKSSGDQISGQSGSPIYSVFSGDRRVVAVVSGGSSPPATNWIGGGQDMVNLISYARNQYP